jgi:hypothetical protein
MSKKKNSRAFYTHLPVYYNTIYQRASQGGTVKFIVTTLATILLLASCAKYRPHSIQSLTFTQEKQTIPTDPTAKAKKLTIHECKRYFSERTAIKLEKAGYTAIQVSLNNQTNKKYILNGTQCSPVTQDLTVINKIVRYNTAQRTAALGIFGLLCWPIFFIPPAIIDGFESTRANDKITRDLERKTITNKTSISINPHEIINKIIFVKKEQVTHKITLKLTEPNTPKIHTLSIAID